MAVARAPVVLLRRLAASPPATTPARATHLVVLVPVHRDLRLNQYEPRGCDKCTDDYTGPLYQGAVHAQTSIPALSSTSLMSSLSLSSSPCVSPSSSSPPPPYSSRSSKIGGVSGPSASATRSSEVSCCFRCNSKASRSRTCSAKGRARVEGECGGRGWRARVDGEGGGWRGWRARVEDEGEGEGEGGGEGEARAGARVRRGRGLGLARCSIV